MENIEYNTILQSAEALLLYFLGFTKRISHRDYHDSFLCPLSLHAKEASRIKNKCCLSTLFQNAKDIPAGPYGSDGPYGLAPYLRRAELGQIHPTEKSKLIRRIITC